MQLLPRSDVPLAMAILLRKALLNIERV
jgi:hypothetical protein